MSAWTPPKTGDAVTAIMVRAVKEVQDLLLASGLPEDMLTEQVIAHMIQGVVIAHVREKVPGDDITVGLAMGIGGIMIQTDDPATRFHALGAGVMAFINQNIGAVTPPTRRMQ